MPQGASKLAPETVALPIGRKNALNRAFYGKEHAR